MEVYETLDLIKWGEKELLKSGVECALHDANTLMRYSQDADSFRNHIEKRVSRYPLQYILKETDFMNARLKMEDGVFIPRPETEILVEKALEVISNIASNTVNILEIGTGSGNIAISLTKNVTNCRIIASDISDSAIETARENAVVNLVSDRVKFVKSDLFGDIPRTCYNYFGMIISNPPYVRREDIAGLQPEISYEDIRALDGGWDGLDFYGRILDEGRRYLKAGGVFLFEIGHDQGEAIFKITKQYKELNGFKLLKDYNGCDRVVIAWIS
ncbi:MAG: peptide chain release factor N(5)-glutamine methyltransferase [Candidatus Omnitrophota bacterium]